MPNKTDYHFHGRIACIGEAMAELSLGNSSSQPVNLGFAGDTLNTAIYMKRLFSESTEISYVSALGRDPLSARMLSFIQSEGILTDKVTISEDRQIGLYAIATDASGERSFSYWRSESAARQLFQFKEGFSALNDFNVLYLSAISLAILPATVRTELLNALDALRKQKKTTVVFDSNYRPKLWESVEEAQQTVANAWRITDIALPSVDDEMALFGDGNEQTVISRLRGYGVARGALKRGGRGPLSLGNDEAISLPVASNVKVIDTTAAGDSFNAGYLAALLSGRCNDIDAMLAGHACALRVIAHPGAIIPASQW